VLYLCVCVCVCVSLRAHRYNSFKVVLRDSTALCQCLFIEKSAECLLNLLLFDMKMQLSCSSRCPHEGVSLCLASCLSAQLKQMLFFPTMLGH